MTRERWRILGFAGVAATVVLVEALIEGLIRGVGGSGLLPPALGAVPFFAILSAQTLRPRSFRLAWVLALVAVGTFLLFPFLGALTVSTEDYSAISTSSAVLILAFTASPAGWVAVAAGIFFVVALVRRGIVHRPSPTPSVDEIAEDA